MDSFLKVLEISKWPFVTLVFGTIFLFLFKSPISDFIRRIKRQVKKALLQILRQKFKKKIVINLLKS